MPDAPGQLCTRHAPGPPRCLPLTLVLLLRRRLSQVAGAHMVVELELERSTRARLLKVGRGGTLAACTSEVHTQLECRAELCESRVEGPSVLRLGQLGNHCSAPGTCAHTQELEDGVEGQLEAMMDSTDAALDDAPRMQQLVMDGAHRLRLFVDVGAGASLGLTG